MADTNAQGKRRACDACHQRKIQCDAATSQCDWCRHHGLVCTFNRLFGRGRRKRASRGDLTYNHEQKSVQIPICEQNSPEISRQPAEGIPKPVVKRSSYAGLGGFFFDGIHLGGIGTYHGIPFFSEEGEGWIYMQTGSVPKFQGSCSGQNTQPRREYPTEVKGTWQIPDRSLVDAYFSIFRKSTQKYVFPIVDETSFLDIVDKAYDYHQDPKCVDVMLAKACVLAFTSISVHMEGKLELWQMVDAEQCVVRIENLMPAIFGEACSESLQVCAMMCMYHMFSGNIAKAATFLSVACRFAVVLGAHLVTPDLEAASSRVDNVWLNQRYVRRVFWHCYMYDKDICLRAGYPPVIDDDHCNLDLPAGYREIDNFDSCQDDRVFIPGDMRLTIIKSKVIKLLYCAKAFSKSETELLRDIRQLDDELERWRESIPSQHRPSLASSYRLHLERAWNKSKKVHLAVIHLEYYLLLALIHSASGRCRTRASGQADHRANMTTCQTLALQASRSTLVNLPAVAQVLHNGDFWYFVLYPIFACLTIFCNILTSPLNPQVENDLQLSKTIPSLIRSMCIVPLTPKDSIRVQQVEDFLVDLTRLASCAIEKASTEQHLLESRA